MRLEEICSGCRPCPGCGGVPDSNRALYIVFCGSAKSHIIAPLHITPLHHHVAHQI